MHLLATQTFVSIWHEIDAVLARPLEPITRIRRLVWRSKPIFTIPFSSRDSASCTLVIKACSQRGVLQHAVLYALLSVIIVLLSVISTYCTVRAAVGRNRLVVQPSVNIIRLFFASSHFHPCSKFPAMLVEVTVCQLGPCCLGLDQPSPQ